MKVTILTVAYNCAGTISRAIESVLQQTYNNIEYIIVDGASTDETLSIAEGYRRQFSDRGYDYRIVSEPDKGMYDALNKGVRLAKGELIGNINADDWYEPEAVEEMISFYKETNYDIAWADLNIIKASGNMVKHAKVGKIWTTAGFCHPTMFAKREILVQLPYVCLHMDDDFDFILRANKAGKRILARKGKPLANYTFGGMSTKKSFRKACQRMQMKYRTYRRNGYSPLYWFYCVVVETAKYILG